MVTTTLLTPARRRALEVIAATHPRPARVSNVTTRTAGAPLVYWKTADWLTAEGLTRVTDTAGLVLTAAGVAACHEQRIEVRS